MRGISKMYRIYERPQDRLKQMLWRGRRTYGREFWALRNISFEVQRGEWMGVIGRNGSGKSTLLQIIAGTLTPTMGEARVHGRVAALLELGSGFNPQFTGRENVFMNGSILGIPRARIAERFDEIAAFADIGDFIDQPVKFYSSGMFLRLAFAVTTSMEPDILLIDEALAVGDVFFRQKCFQRLDELSQRGVSILLVSHSMMDIEQFCRRTLLLEHGRMIFNGEATEGVKRYMLLDQQDRIPELEPDPIPATFEPLSDDQSEFWPAPGAFINLENAAQVSNGWARCTAMALCNSQGQACRVFQQGERASFFYEFELLHDIEAPISGTVLHNDKGILVHGKSSLEYGTSVPRYAPAGSRLRVRHDIALEVAAGEYTFEPGLSTMGWRNFERRSEYSYADLHGMMLRLCHLPVASHFVVVYPKYHRPIQLLHHGIANLPGDCRIALKLPAQPGDGDDRAPSERE